MLLARPGALALVRLVRIPESVPLTCAGTDVEDKRDTEDKERGIHCVVTQLPQNRDAIHKRQTGVFLLLTRTIMPVPMQTRACR